MGVSPREAALGGGRVADGRLVSQRGAEPSVCTLATGSTGRARALAQEDLLHRRAHAEIIGTALPRHSKRWHFPKAGPPRGSPAPRQSGRRPPRTGRGDTAGACPARSDPSRRSGLRARTFEPNSGTTGHCRPDATSPQSAHPGARAVQPWLARQKVEARPSMSAEVRALMASLQTPVFRSGPWSRFAMHGSERSCTRARRLAWRSSVRRWLCGASTATATIQSPMKHFAASTHDRKFPMGYRPCAMQDTCCDQHTKKLTLVQCWCSGRGGSKKDFAPLVPACHKSRLPGSHCWSGKSRQGSEAGTRAACKQAAQTS